MSAAGKLNTSFGTQGVASLPFVRSSALAYSAKAGGIVLGARRNATDPDLLVALVSPSTGGLSTFWGANGVTDAGNDCPGNKAECHTRALALAANGTLFFCAPRNDGAYVASTDVGGTAVPFPRFSTSLFVDTCTSLGLDAMNRLYVGGSTSGAASVGRFQTNGGVDGLGWAAAGDRPGVAIAPPASNMIVTRRVVVGADGKLLVAADSTVGGLAALAVWRLLPDGTTDTSFAAPQGYVVKTVGSTSVAVKTMSVDSEGRILVAGGNGEMVVARFWP